MFARKELLEKNLYNLTQIQLNQEIHNIVLLLYKL